MGALNHHHRPHPVAVTACAPVKPDWHARFSAIERRYTYRLIARRAPLVLDAGLAWRVPHDLALAPMQDAARHLLGRHDFTTFRASECQADSPLRTLDEAAVTAHPIPGGTAFSFTFRARSFLHSQVRSMVGTLERVGAGVWTPADVAAALAARDRAACGPVCPPDGLVLTGVGYPQDPFATPPQG
jgi:tRNA pseudouridine38-40 synthase